MKVRIFKVLVILKEDAMKGADLHIHTTASDGRLSPDEVIRWAHKKNLSAISITDHDTVSGLTEALDICKDNSSLEIIPGIELNTVYQKEEVHILGYYIDYKNPRFLGKLKEIQNARYDRANKIVEKLNNLGIAISFQQVRNIAKGESVGRPHIAQIMVENGYVESTREAFDKYIGENQAAYVERFKLKTEDAIKLIKSVNGVSVLAHPGLIHNKSIIPSVVELGIQGMEVYHTKHSGDMENYLYEFANQRNLLITGGTDCHGRIIDNEPILGNITISYDRVLALKSAAKKV